jgi:hypothetical protein
MMNQMLMLRCDKMGANRTSSMVTTGHIYFRLEEM